MLEPFTNYFWYNYIFCIDIPLYVFYSFASIFFWHSIKVRLRFETSSPQTFRTHVHPRPVTWYLNTYSRIPYCNFLIWNWKFYSWISLCDWQRKTKRHSWKQIMLKLTPVKNMSIKSSIVFKISRKKFLFSLNFLYVNASFNAMVVLGSINFRELFYLKLESTCLPILGWLESMLFLILEISDFTLKMFLFCSCLYCLVWPFWTFQLLKFLQHVSKFASHPCAIGICAITLHLILRNRYNPFSFCFCFKLSSRNFF